MNSSDKSIIKKYNPSTFAKATADKSEIERSAYKPSEIEQKWQDVWEREKIYSPNLETAAKPFYNLMMFPYPSAEGMHVGNMYAFTGADVYGRFQRMQGKDVFEPIGLDGFGIHSENYAIKVGKHPIEQAKISEKNFYRQLKSIGNSFDWTRTIETYKPKYYKWTQWLFIQLFKAGLAYRKKAPVNFCPSCKTVLADEQVIEKLKTQKSKLKITTQNSKFTEEKIGVCERCETPVEKQDLEQWFFKITKYADRLLANIDKLDWSEKVKIAQRQWIGRSEGTIIKFQISNFKFQINVFTTRPDTLFGATFIVLSPEHPLVDPIDRPDVRTYVRQAKKKTEEERLTEGKEKTGVFSGLYAINPANKEKIQIWIADYILMGYGTGAIMAVPAHDQRDFEFAKRLKLPIKQVISSNEANIDKEAYVGEGEIVNSNDWNGWRTPDSISKVIDWLSKKGLGEKKANYHLRDWLISRQRYWGPPIPMIFCQSCAWQPVPEDQLPVELPFIEDYKPLGTGQAPLASHPEFYKTKCPNCGKDAKRETDVSDTFLDSSWYFLRYIATEFDTVPFDKERVKKWLPVNMYIGGAEHSVLHLLYSRFIAMALKDLGFISFEEPFTQFRAHGLIVKDGAKMSKSKGNVIIPDKYIKKFGADALRTYLMFMGPFSQGGDFRDSGIEGMFRFLKRIWTLFSEYSENSVNQSVRKSDASDNQKVRRADSSEFSQNMMHKTIKKVTEDISNLSYNTAIAALMEWYNYLSEKLKVKSEKLSGEEMETFTKLIAPFAPHVSEEIWQNIILSANEGSHEILRYTQNDKSYVSIHNSAWPTYDPKFLVKDEIIVAVQVNGKLRDILKAKSEKLKVKSFVEQLAKQSAKVQKYLEGKKILKVIYVEGKVINFVVS